MHVKETLKKFGWRIAAGVTCIAAVVLGILVKEGNSEDRRRTKEIRDLVDAAGDCNKSALDGIKEAERILQKAKSR